jgi:hypothetical protein
MMALAPLDWWTGRDLATRWGLPGRSIWYSGPVAAAATWPHWWVGASWALWRGVLGWSSFGGSLDPRTVRQVLGLAARNAVGVVPLALAAHFIGGRSWGVCAALCAVFVVLATEANLWLAIEAERGRDVDSAVDALHGLAFGLVCLCLLML